jgi:DNA helicase-2/ATP-dependent DNA helicase PcrA
MSIQSYSFNNQEEQYYWISKKLKKLIENGQEPSEIALIARKHDTLERLSFYLKWLNLPVSYQRIENIFEVYEITLIINIVDYCTNLLNYKDDSKADILPEILASSVWSLSSLQLWEISKKSHLEKKNWLDTMKDCESEYEQNLAKFFIELSKLCASYPIERILDIIVGNEKITLDNGLEFVSPIKQNWFDNQDSSEQKILFLTRLETLYSSIRSHQKKSILYAKDFVEFIELCKNSKIKIFNTSKYSKKVDGVNLLTAHKSKGMEFETVFIVNCSKSEWSSNKGKSNKISLPKNLNLSPEKDNLDDQIRLFYVAVTRAKKDIYLTKAELDEKQKNIEEIAFLDINWQSAEIQKEELEDVLSIKISVPKRLINTKSEIEFLKPLVEDYQLSVTHFNNFLNEEKGGSKYFLEKNLLRFPQAISPSGGYGSSVHFALNKLYADYKKTKVLPSLSSLIEDFLINLKSQRLIEDKFLEFSQKGSQHLTSFYNYKLENNGFNINSRTEFDFKYQNVFIQNAHLTGKIDVMEIDNENNEILVIDYKTGKPTKSWTDSSKQNIEDYKRQLWFYKLLVEKSTEFGSKYKVKQGRLEFVEFAQSLKKPELNLIITDSEIAEFTTQVIEVYNRIINLDF